MGILSKKPEKLVTELVEIYTNNPQGFGIDDEGKDTKYIMTNGGWLKVDGTYEVKRIKKIGKLFNQEGGMDHMRMAHKIFSEQCMSIRGAARNLEIVWDGIGDWKG